MASVLNANVLVAWRAESSSGVGRDFFKKVGSMERSGHWPLMVFHG